MKSLTILTRSSPTTLLIFQGCGKTEAAVPVGQDEKWSTRTRLRVHHPLSRKLELGDTIGKALFTESQDMATKFIDQDPGGRVMVEAIAYAGKTSEAIIEAGKGCSRNSRAETEPPGGGHRRLESRR